MTKKDFELIARVLRPWAGNGDSKAQAIAADFADELGRFPSFDRARFMKAAGAPDR